MSLASILLLPTLALSLLGCFSKDGGDDDDDDDDGGTGGWDLGTGDDTGVRGDGGGGDGGGGDGGGGDGGGSDGGGGDGGGGDGGGGDGGGGDGGGSDGGGGDGGGGDGGGDGGGGDGGGGDGGGSEVDTGILTAGYSGQARVSSTAYDGFEEAYYVGWLGGLDCAIHSTLTGRGLDVPTCSDCMWAFSVVSSDSVLSSTLGCDLVGVSAADVSDWDGATYNYGYQDDYIGYYGDEVGVLRYYFAGYGWYAVAYADYVDRNFTYDWPSGYYYYER